MNDNYNFLGLISAVYEFANADENYYITLAVFNNANNLKIYYKDLAISGLSDDAKEGEIILNNMSYSELILIIKNFDNRVIRELILAKLSEHIRISSSFDVVY